MKDSESCFSNRYQYYKGLHVLRLSGNDYEMGFQHGKILKDAVHCGAIPYFSTFTEGILKETIGNTYAPIIAKLLRITVGKKLEKCFPDNIIQGLNGLVDGSGIPGEQLMKAVVMPETFLWLASSLMKIRKPDKAPRFMVPLMGCSSIIASGSATAKNTFLHGRNFDYQGVGYWDKEAAVIFHEPNNSQSYVSLSSAGILFGGITSMNQSGLTLAVHQHLSCNDFSLKKNALPVGIIGDKVMREAYNLSDAVKILDSHVSIGCWTYIITSGKERKVLCYEVTPENRSWFISDSDTFGYTNIFLDKNLADTEMLMYPSHWRSNAGRYHCIQDGLKKNYGKIDENTIASILGERNNKDCRLSEPLAMLLTVASVVFRPDDGAFFVASGPSPTSNCPFVAFSLDKKAPLYDVPDLTGGIPTDKNAALAFEYYRSSYDAYFNRHDTDTAIMKLEKAIKIQPKEALYHYILGLLSINDHAISSALEAFNKAIFLGHKCHERASAMHLWRARVHDLLNQRGKALEDYKEALSGDPPVYSAALKGLRKSWKWEKINIEFNYADVVNP